MKEIVEILKEKNETISTMESCTGGFIVNAITNIEGASNVLKYSAVTYSNEFKIKMGVPKEVIDEFTVYSTQTSKAMAKAISDFTESTYGIGVTGQLNVQDMNNIVDNSNMIYVCIYNRKTDEYQTITLEALETRIDSKQRICNTIIRVLRDIIK